MLPFVALVAARHKRFVQPHSDKPTLGHLPAKAAYLATFLTVMTFARAPATVRLDY